MNFAKKIDRAFQWAGEKMGSEAKTGMSEDFKMLEQEMALRYDGMDRLHKSMNAYVKWLGRRGDTFEDGEKGLPASYLGRTMASHGEDFDEGSAFGNGLIKLGHANEKMAVIQETYVADATAVWLESLERSLAVMKEYQASRKKLESRRLAYDASMTKMQKARRDDFRIEEELRTAKAKYEESSEDVMRRMQDIKDGEADCVADLTRFLDTQLDYHERCAEELRAIRQSWPASTSSNAGSMERRPTGRSRSNTARSYTDRVRRSVYEAPCLDPEPESQAVRGPIRSPTTRSNSVAYSNAGSGSGAVQQPELPQRPSLSRTNTFQSNSSRVSNNSNRMSTHSIATPASTASYGVNQNVSNVYALRGQLRPIGRTNRDDGHNMFDDERDTASGSGSPEWGERSASPATSFGSLSRTPSNVGFNGGSAAPTLATGRKAPPPPPPSRSKKPAPPVPVKREFAY